MGDIIAVHSFRGGTGKSNLAANMATAAAMQGYRVGIVDTDIQSPGAHVLFGFDETMLDKALNDYLWGKAPIEDTAYPIHETVADQPGRAFLKPLRMWLIPSSIRTGEIARVLREGYDVGLLNEGFHTLLDKLRLDYLLIDTHPGLNEETLLSIAVSNAVAIILRPDQQDFQGTAVTVDVARKLDVPRMHMIVNKVLARYDFGKIKAQVEAAYDVPVAGVLPLSEDVAANASSNVFCALYPDHPWSDMLRQITDRVLHPDAQPVP
ncbi:MAG TPA: MinD/ParA family protein [Aggregatilinea sp.]|uniref:MinD/ParA family ATP-binding protein n=1 Tax=Aggregatilinea sp. TaxID=2806333 RepID=UPI002B60A0C2|nr:MinD/ParA family protein [Aggregatilinea sp.]HML24023.1 MinD/ParA family protein [Aggregatilinea sp.]